MAINWAFNFALAWAVPPALSHIPRKTYFIFYAFNFAAAAIHFTFYFPETVQRTLEEIEEAYVISLEDWEGRRKEDPVRCPCRQDRVGIVPRDKVGCVI